MTDMQAPQVSTLQTILLALLALVPAIILLIYIYAKDRVEKEPFKLLFKLFIFGALIAIPVAVAEVVLDDFVLLGVVFRSAWIEVDGAVYWDSIPYYIYHITKYILVVALCEELGKYLVLKKITANNREFNSLFDGIVYAVFVSLGFAALENVIYVVKGAISGGMSAGIYVALIRTVSAVPAHMFFAILMGYNYSLSHIYGKAAALEIEYARMGYIANRSSHLSENVYLKKAIIIPIVIHGLYDIFATIPGWFSTVCWLALVVGMYIFCFRKVKQFSKADSSDFTLAQRIVFMRYPMLESILSSASDDTFGSAM